MFGEVVHNPIVVKDLQKKGLLLVKDIGRIPDGDHVKVLVRAHGVSASTVTALSNRGFEIIDKTCPKVKEIHDIVAEASSRGLDMIVVGAPDHPEIEGIVGWAKTKTVILHDIEEAKRIIPNEKFSENGVCMVSQTTHNKHKYEEIHEFCSSIIPNIEFHSTVCATTSNRQNEVRKLAEVADGFIIVGGKTSSNVMKLYEIASEYCEKTQHIESAEEIDFSKLTGVNTLVVTGGASTPDSSVDETIDAVRAYCTSRLISFEKAYTDRSL